MGGPIRTADGLFWGASYLVLGHLVVVYETGFPVGVLVLWYVTANMLGILTIVDELGYSPSEGSMSDTLTAVEVLLSGLVCALVAVVLVGETGLTAPVLTVVAGAFAVVMIWGGLRDREGVA